MDDRQQRRLTDREVALVLRKAVEIEEHSQAQLQGRGLTPAELEEVAGEVGIRAETLRQALADVDATAHRTPGSLFLAPLARKRIVSIAGAVSRDDLSRLVNLIDRRVAGTGTVSEALGAVRWTSTDRFLTVQVSLTPRDEDTTIHVEERYIGRLQRLMHIVPAFWGGILGTMVAAGLGSAGLAFGGLVGAGAVVGAAVGRAVWGAISGRSGRRVERLAAELSAEARRLSDEARHLSDEARHLSDEARQLEAGS